MSSRPCSAATAARRCVLAPDARPRPRDARPGVDWPSFRGPHGVGRRGRLRDAREVGRGQGRGRALEDADPRARRLEPDRLGRHAVRDHGRQQRSEGVLPPRPLRRRRAVEGRGAALLARAVPRQEDRQGPLGEGRPRGRAEDQAPPQVQPGLRDAGHRRQDRGRALRLRGPLRLRPAGQAAVEARPRRAQRRLVLRPRLRVGRRQLADHLEGPRDRAVRHPEGLLRRRLPREGRRAGLAHRARRDPVLAHADGRRRSTARPSSSPTRPSSSAATTRRRARSCGGSGRTPRSRRRRRSWRTASST